eukprot:5849327-Pleurochrysis_carterae.AAC.2
MLWVPWSYKAYILVRGVIPFHYIKVRLVASQLRAHREHSIGARHKHTTNQTTAPPAHLALTTRKQGISPTGPAARSIPSFHGMA